MKVLRTGLLPAVLLAAFAAAGCATPQPSASAVPPSATAVPAASAASSPSPSGSSVAVEPKVVCQPNTTPVWAKTEANGSQVPIVITLTCENAVAAAKTVVGPDPAVAYIEFTYGDFLCPPNTPCPALPPNTGYVVFHRKGLLPELLVWVTADETGKAIASEPTPLPSPSPTG